MIEMYNTFIGLAIAFFVIFLLHFLFKKLTSIKLTFGVIGLIMIVVPWSLLLTKGADSVSVSFYSVGTIVGLILIAWDVRKKIRSV